MKQSKGYSVLTSFWPLSPPTQNSLLPGHPTGFCFFPLVHLQPLKSFFPIWTLLPLSYMTPCLLVPHHPGVTPSTALFWLPSLWWQFPNMSPVQTHLHRPSLRCFKLISVKTVFVSHLLWTECLRPPPNSYTEILTPKAKALRGGASEGRLGHKGGGLPNGKVMSS